MNMNSDMSYLDCCMVKQLNNVFLQNYGVRYLEYVEIIINNLLDMGRYQSMKMFNYGAFFTEKQNQQ